MSFHVQTPAADASPVSATALSVILLAAFIGLFAASYRSFQIKPVGDDFPYANEIARGEQQGPMALLTQSFTKQTYRPLTSLCIWAIGRGPLESKPTRLRLLGYFFMAFYAIVAALWIWSMRMTWTGALVALLLMMLHPVLPASLCSIDGFNGLASSGFLWLGAWLGWRCEGRPVAAATGVFLCMILGAGFKEYVFALVPLSGWTALLLTRHRSWRYALLVSASAGAGFLIIPLLRRLTLPPGGGAEQYFKLDPLAWARNAALFTVGLLFFGDSVWAYLRQDAVSFATIAASVVLSLIVIGVGSLRWSRAATSTSRRFAGFLIGGLALAAFPAIFTERISEMYVAPLVLPLALLAGLSADGWRTARPIIRAAVAALAIVALITSALAVHSKTQRMVELGDRADHRLRQLLAILPPDAHDCTVVVLFDPQQLPPRRTYSVYLAGDDALLVQPITFEWLAPGRGLVLQTYWIGDPRFDPRRYDLVLLWDPATQTYKPVNMTPVP